MILDLDKSNPDIYYRLGEIEYLMNEYDMSKNNLLKAVELSPKNPDYYILLAKVYANGYKDKNKTLEYLEKSFINGFKNLDLLQQTSEFKLLFELEEFKKLLVKYNVR
jgi:tetratricopeptide (TPR) repeat protein